MRGSVLRRARVALGVLIAITVAVGLPAAQPDLGLAQTLQKPNIVFILADDLDVNSISYMPTLKTRLIDQGTTFKNAFVTDALCCPSRATILRGQYTHNHQIWTNRYDMPPGGGFKKFRELGHESSTVATWLQSAGYRTVLFGKYLNEYDRTYIPQGWDEWYATPNGYYDHYSVNENGTIIKYQGTYRNYSTDVFAKKADDYIRRTVEDGRPFFMYWAPMAPHSPATPAPRHQDAFADITTMPRTPSFNEEDVSDKPAWVRDKPLLTADQISEMDSLYRRRLQSMLAVDEAIWRLVKALKDTGKLDNTYIIFTSDHGWHMGLHRLGMGKWTAYEEDIHVPLIVRGPGVPAGQTLEHLVLNNDFAPTFADLAGADAPPFVDGVSLKPLLSHSPQRSTYWRSAFMIEGAETVSRPFYEAVRTERYLYAEYSTGERELYDLFVDPYELQNQYATADPELIARLASQLEKFRGCSAEACRVAEDWPTFDATPPITTAASWPKPNKAGWNSADLTVALAAMDEEGGSGVRELSYSTSGAQEMAGQTVQSDSARISLASEGVTTISYSATDHAGNAEAEKTLTVRLDKTSPESEIVSGPDGLTNDNTPTFDFAGTDNLVRSEDLLYSYRLDDGTWSNVSRATSVTLGEGTVIPNGAHAMYVKAIDLARNEDVSPAQRNFMVVAAPSTAER